MPLLTTDDFLYGGGNVSKLDACGLLIAGAVLTIKRAITISNRMEQLVVLLQ